MQKQKCTKTKFAPKMDSSLLVVKYCKSYLGCVLFEMKQSPEKAMVILEEKNHFDPIKGMRLLSEITRKLLMARSFNFANSM